MRAQSILFVRLGLGLLATATAVSGVGVKDRCWGQETAQAVDLRESGTVADEETRILQEIQAIRERLERIEALVVGQKTARTDSAKVPEKVAEVQVIAGGLRIHHDTPVAPLQIESTIPLGNGHHIILEYPRELAGYQYTPRNGYQGKVRFDVLNSQVVVLAMYGKEWGAGGNPSGNWEPEVSSPDDLRKQGWEPFGQIDVAHSNPQFTAEPAWQLYRRNCDSGESFLIRNHKYQAPLLIWKAK